MSYSDFTAAQVRTKTSRSGPSGRFRWLIAVAPIVLSALGGVQTAMAQKPVTVENMRVGFDASMSSLHSSNSFKIGSWTPIWVQLRGGGERFSGYMDVSVADDDGTPTSFRMPVEVPANQSARFTAYGRPGSRQPEFSVRLLDQDGRRVGGASQDMVMPTAPESIMPDESLVLSMGRPQGIEAIAELPGFQINNRGINRARSNGSGVEIVTAHIDPQMGSMPGRWYGYDAARVIVVDTSDRETMSALDALRGQPLVDWVARGGHLVVAVGANWQAVRDSVLASILPGLPSGQEKVPSLAELDAFAGSNKQITPPGAPPVLVTKLEEMEQRGASVLAQTSKMPLVIRGAHGFGRVTLVAMDVDQKPFSDWADRALFWVRALDLKRPRQDQTGASPNAGGQFYQYGASDIASQLRVALEQFPGVKLIPFGWVAFFIFLYILLIGPGDYFFLKKVLKRMELTWITFPTIVITVSLLAYYAAYVLKGNDLLVNKVDVVDIDQVTGVARGSSWISMFSPQNRDYTIRAIPLPLDKDAPPSEPGSTSVEARPTAGTEVITTWFSAPEDQFGAMGNSGRRFSFAGSGYSYEPVSGVEWIDGVRIPIWSTKCIYSRWFGSAVTLVDADLQPAGTDRLTGTVTNRQSVPLEDVVLAFGKHVYIMGKLAPGATMRVELSPNDRNLSGLLKDKQKNYLSDQPWNRERRIDRSDLMLAAMFHDSESTLSSDRVLSNVSLQDLDLSGQLALERPMLVARIARAASRLVLDNVSAPPKIEQLTMVRIILPLNKKAKS
jgi:hypothetical protein